MHLKVICHPPINNYRRRGNDEGVSASGPRRDSSWIKGDHMMSSISAQGEGDDVTLRKEKQNQYLNMTEGENDGVGEGKKTKRRSDDKRERCEQIGILGELGSMQCLTGILSEKEETEEILPLPGSAHPSPTFTHLLHFSPEEMATAPQIVDESFPEMSVTESLHSSPRSCGSSPGCPQESGHQVLRPSSVTVTPDSGLSDRGLKESMTSHQQQQQQQQPIHVQRKTNQPWAEVTPSKIPTFSLVSADSLKFRSKADVEPSTPRARTKAAKGNASRFVPLSHHLPDFSKVEPRVRFPKEDGYKPPASRPFTSRASLSPELPVFFKPPADIMKEVLRNVTDEYAAPSDPNEPVTSGPSTTESPVLGCRKEATTLLELLQEDYNRLLLKYAEAENTIDRMRLQVKVEMLSEPPKPGHLIQGGLSHRASNFTAFPQPQRAAINSAAPRPNGAGEPSQHGVNMGQQLAQIIYDQANKFLQQLQKFEDLIERKILKPSEQAKGVSQLSEGLAFLERGYLLALDELKVLEQRGGDTSHFDPERKLERLIYQCGVSMDELKEQVERIQQEPPSPSPSPTPTPQPRESSAPSRVGECLQHPEGPHIPLLVHPGRAAEFEVSSASVEIEETETETEDESLDSLFLHPVNGNHRHVEQDFASLMDSYHSYKELPKTFEVGKSLAGVFSGGFGTHMQSEFEGTERRTQRNGDMDLQTSLPRRKAESDLQDSPACSSEQKSFWSSPASRGVSGQSSSPPLGPPRSLGGSEKSRSSSLSSLGGTPASEERRRRRRNSKLQTGSRRQLSQGGIVTPETDSGFVCSESSLLTPTVAACPLHQRSSQRLLAHQERNTATPQREPVSAPEFPESSHPRSATQSRSSAHSDRSWPSRPDLSRCQQLRLGHTGPTGERVGARPCDSDSAAQTEEGQSDHYAESVDSLLSSHPGSSVAARHHHRGDSPRAAGSRQMSNLTDALQAEVTRLTGKLESCLRKEKPLRSTRAAPSAPSAQGTHRFTSTPHIRPAERCPMDVRRVVDEVLEFNQKRAARERSPGVDRRNPQRDIFRASEPEAHAPQAPPRISKSTPTYSPAPGSCHSATNSVRSKRTRPRQHPAPSTPLTNTAEEPDGRKRQTPPIGLKCASRQRGQSGHVPKETLVRLFKGPSCASCVGGTVGPTRSSSTSSSHCCLCPVCGHLDPNRVTETERRRDSPKLATRHPAESPDRAQSSRLAAPPPVRPQCMLVGSPLLLYSLPMQASPSNSAGSSSGVRGHGEAKGRTRRSRSSSVDVSLNRAIRAARRMKLTSGHMARSMASGLQHQDGLALSY